MIETKGVLIRNIYYMLAYAFQVLRQNNFKEVATEEFENIHDFLAAILAKGVSQQLKQGLYREYISIQEDLPGLKGKLQIPDTIRERLKQRQSLSCEFEELSPNNIYNQILKTTASLLIRHPKLRKECRADLVRTQRFFAGVNEVEPSSIRWSTFRFQRSNQGYRLLMYVCYFVLTGLLLATESGKYRLASFLDDQAMSRLYERFVMAYFRRHHPYLKPSPTTVDWNLDDGSEADFLPKMFTDITLRYGDKTLIIDTKYYSQTMQVRQDYGSRTLHSHNLYQIFTYVKNMDKSNLGNVAGMLLYAKTNETIAPDCGFNMGGNRISVKTLDLNTPFPNIATQLDRIVEDYFGKSAKQSA